MPVTPTPSPPSVLGPLTYEPNNLTIGSSQLAGFECHAPNSLPPAHVTWFKDSVPLQLSERVLVSQDTGTLFIRDVSEGMDAGAYHCLVENIAGSMTSRHAYLTVITGIPSGGKYGTHCRKIRELGTMTI